MVPPHQKKLVVKKSEMIRRLRASGLGLTLLCFLAAGLSRAVGQDPVPLGNQFQVNTYTTSIQSSASVAVDPDGDFVVVWNSWGSYGTDTSYRSIQGQHYDASGTPVGDQFQVNTYTTDNQLSPAVAFAATGSFVVVWVRYPTAQGKSIQGQRFDASGAPMGGQFQVNTYTPFYRYHPDVAIDPQGNFVVVWESYVPQVDTSIQGQRFDASGAPVGGQFQVDSYTTSWQNHPTVAADVQGNFVVVWDSAGSYGTDTSYRSIQGQRYDANGVPVGDQFQVNAYTTYSQNSPDVAADAQGNFVVVWGGYTSHTDRTIQGQRFDTNGVSVGSEFQVDSYTTNGQEIPTVAADARGNFVVVWESDGSDGSDTSSKSIQAQHFDASGSPVGGQFQVNSYTTGHQGFSTVAAHPDGNFVVAWESDGSDGSDSSLSSIQGQRFASPAIFTDGFESGDTSEWSSSVP